MATKRPLHPHDDTDDALWPISMVRSITTLSRSTIYAWVKDGRFPAPLRLSARCVRWSAGAVRAWMRQRIEEATA